MKSLILLTILTNLIFPYASAILCHFCDSINLADCAVNPDANLPYTQCSYACAMSIVDQNTYRGCSDNTPRGPEYYKQCQTPLCNGGVYPPGRLKCHQCQADENCLNKQDQKPKACLNHMEEDLCYFDVVDSKTAFRGCFSDENRTYTSRIEFCDFNGCNNLTAIKTFECAQCDSVNDKDCKRDLFQNQNCQITNPKTCLITALAGFEQESCFSYHKLDRVVRGCSQSADPSFDPEFIDNCDSDKCNNKCMENVDCIVCDSKDDPSCKNAADSLRTSLCISAEATSCYTCELYDGNVIRGCGAPPKNVYGKCSQCQGEKGCNKQHVSKCYSCSSEDDPNCSRWLNTSLIESETCSINDENCIFGVKKNGHVIRGCKSTLKTACENDTDCWNCHGDYCNEGLFGLNSLKCFHSETDILGCVNLADDNRCFEYLDDSFVMQRGCKKDDAFNACSLPGINCRECIDDGCNNSPAFRKASISCLNCTENSNPACGWMQDNYQIAVKCGADIPFGMTESCFTQESVNDPISRGCTIDTFTLKTPSNLKLCNTTNCNTDTVKLQMCAKCDSRNNVECEEGGDNLEVSACSADLSKYSLRGCYVKREFLTGNESYVIRDCASELGESGISTCNWYRNRHCIYCNNDACNLMKAPDSATSLSSSVLANAVLVFLWKLYLN